MKSTIESTRRHVESGVLVRPADEIGGSAPCPGGGQRRPRPLTRRFSLLMVTASCRLFRLSRAVHRPPDAEIDHLARPSMSCAAAPGQFLQAIIGVMKTAATYASTITRRSIVQLALRHFARVAAAAVPATVRTSRTASMALSPSRSLNSSARSFYLRLPSRFPPTKGNRLPHELPVRPDDLRPSHQP